MTQPGNKTFPSFVVLIGLALVGAGLYFWMGSASSPNTVAPSTAASSPEEVPVAAAPAATPAIRPSPVNSSSPNVPVTAAAPSPAEVGQERKVQILREILSGNGDNDPRMDGELLHLDTATKRAFRAEYQQTILERRNARGTIVFLLGRNLSTPEDFAFMKSVLSEAPCLSLQDCRGTANDPIGEGAAEHEHDDGAATEKVLNYPQAVALESMAREVANGSFNAEQKKELAPVLLKGTASKIPFVARRSREILNSLGEMP